MNERVTHQTTEADRAYKLRVHDLIQCSVDSLQAIKFGSLIYARDAAHPLSQSAAKAIDIVRAMVDEAIAELGKVNLNG